MYDIIKYPMLTEKAPAQSAQGRRRAPLPPMASWARPRCRGADGERL